MSKTTQFDCIVVGFGGVGSAALRSAAMRGWKVLGLDRFGPAHDRGSSHGQTRIIRRAYFEHPSYVPLAIRAYEMWDELNKRHRTSIEIKQLIETCGLLQIGLPDSEVIRGVQSSADQHDLPIERFTAEEIERRLPLFQVPDSMVGLFEPGAGFLRVEQCVAAAIHQAQLHGAEIQSNVIVDRWEVDSDRVISVFLDDGSRLRTKRLIIAGGAWSPELLPGLSLGLNVLQKQQHWFQLDRVDQKWVNGCPAFLLEQADGTCFYGLPEIDYLGMKVCLHSGGRSIEHPDSLATQLDRDELGQVESLMGQYLRFGRSRLVHDSRCMYTMSPDGQFVVDLHPDSDQVAFACGLSGHGFKFAPVLGAALVDLLEGQRDPDLEFLRMNRFAN